MEKYTIYNDKNNKPFAIRLNDINWFRGLILEMDSLFRNNQIPKVRSSNGFLYSEIKLEDEKLILRLFPGNDKKVLANGYIPSKNDTYIFGNWYGIDFRLSVIDSRFDNTRRYVTLTRFYNEKFRNYSIVRQFKNSSTRVEQGGV